MATNPDSRPLPDGWVQQFNEGHKAWFYVNTKAPGGPASQWTHPADDAPKQEAYAPPAGAPPSFGTTNSYSSNRNEYNGEKATGPTYQSSPVSPVGQSSSPYPGQYGGQQAEPKKKGLGGFLQDLKNKASAPRPQGQYAGGGYGQQGYGQQYQQYPQQGYGGYPQQQYYPQQGGMMGGPMMGGGGMYGRPQRQGMGAGSAAMLGVGGGLLGGMLIGDMIQDGQQDAYQDGYMDGGGGDDYGGDMGGGDF